MSSKEVKDQKEVVERVEREIERAKSGDPEAFVSIVRAFEQRVYNLSLRMLRDPEEARDATQEIFLRIHSRLGSYRGESRFSTWVYRLATHLLLDRLRRMKRERQHRVGRPWEEIPGREKGREEDDPAVIVQKKETEQRVQEAIDSLPDKYRVVVLLHYQGGLSYRDIGEILGIPAQTVGTHLHRAKKHLRERLHPIWKGERIDGGT